MRLDRCNLGEGRLYHILAGGALNFSRQGITGIASVLLNAAAALFVVFAKPLVGVFTTDDEVIRTGAVILRYQCISFPFLAFYAVSSMYM